MKNITRTAPVTYIPKWRPLIFQKATIHRQVIVNNDETQTYGEWSKDYWKEFNTLSQDIGFFNSSKVDKQIVDGNTQDQTVDIYY